MCRSFFNQNLQRKKKYHPESDYLKAYFHGHNNKQTLSTYSRYDVDEEYEKLKKDF